MTPHSIKDLVAASRYAQAAEALDAILKDATLQDFNFLINQGEYLERFPVAFMAERGLLCKRLAVLGGYTTSFLVPLLRLALYARGIFAVIHEGAYGAFERQIRGASSELKDFAPDLCYLCVGAQHLLNDRVEDEIERWASLLVQAHEVWTCEIIVNNFIEPGEKAYGNFEAAADSMSRYVKRLNWELLSRAPAYAHFCDVEALASFHGKSRWFSHKLYDLGKLPASPAFHFDYARNVAAIAAAVYGRGKKCLVLDLDNTLWGGVVGDDGLAGIKIGEDSGDGEAFRRFQAFLKELKGRGVLLAVCSKNDLENAKEPFVTRTDMVLSLKDISCFKANWKPKHENIVAIAEELNIGLDSLVFVDDDPAERELVRRNLPMVTVLDLPPDPAAYATIVSRCGWFESVRVTDDDLRRTKRYAENRQRNDLRAGFENYDDYLSSLDMRAIVAEFDDENIPRITQLINQSSQFNLTTRRYTESEVAALRSSGRMITRYVKLKDKFGDNGLISAAAVRRLTAHEAEIDTWVMSCRVLSRGVERLLFRSVLEELRRCGIKRLRGTYLPTAKNKLVCNLLQDLGMDVAAGTPDGAVHCELDLEDEGRVQARCSQALHIRSVTVGDY